jgi:hypothetical protein
MQGEAMPVSNHGPFRIIGSNGMDFRMFVCDDGIVIVRPSIIRHLPGGLISQFLGGAVGGGIGGGIDGAMGLSEYRKADQRAEAADFTSAKELAALLPRSSQYPADQITAASVKKNKVTFTLQKGRLSTLGLHKLMWRIGRDDTSILTALRELFGDRFQVLK